MTHHPARFGRISCSSGMDLPHHKHLIRFILIQLFLQSSFAQLRCRFPGCTSCGLLLGCLSCAIPNYQLLGNRCGCAPGYGSWAVPPVAGSLFPSVPPVCPIAATAVENSTETAAAIAAKTTEDAASDQSDSANAASTTPEQLGGTCTCLLCPNGYTSPGGAIRNTPCTAGPRPPNPNPSVNCPGSPRLPANARPWRNCANGSFGDPSCRAGFNGPTFFASCTSTNNGWSVTQGACRAITVCAGFPPQLPGVLWDAACPNTPVTQPTPTPCKASGYGCPPLNTRPNAVPYSECLAGGRWGTPVPAVCPVRCSGPPPGVFNGGFYDTCDNLFAGQVCTGECLPGFAGAIRSECLATGVWAAVEGSCN